MRQMKEKEVEDLTSQLRDRLIIEWEIKGNSKKKETNSIRVVGANILLLINFTVV